MDQLISNRLTLKHIHACLIVIHPSSVQNVKPIDQMSLTPTYTMPLCGVYTFLGPCAKEQE